MTWSLSWRCDPRAVALYDRHYSRRPSSVGAPNVAPPGWVLVLVHETLAALWVVSRQRDEWVKHAWVGAWRCTVFRFERDDRGGASKRLDTLGGVCDRERMGSDP